METIADTAETRFVTLELPPEIKSGKHKLAIVINEEGDDSDLPEEMDQAYKKELDIRLKRMQEAGIPGKNPFRSWRRDLERKLRLESEAIDDLMPSDIFSKTELRFFMISAAY